MRKMRKAALAVACAAVLVVGTVAGTMAYLTSTDEVKNTFTVGNVAITLDEASVDELGAEYKASDWKEGMKDNEERDIEIDGQKNVVRVDSNTYKLIPGHEYTKDPIVHVDSNSESCYLFVKVENEISAIEDSTNNVAAQMAAKGWKALGEGYANIYVYVGTAASATNPLAVKAGTNVPVFEGFKVGSSVTGTALADYNGKTIDVTAYAIQEDGFKDKTAVEIWTVAGFGADGSSSEGE